MRKWLVAGYEAHAGGTTQKLTAASDEYDLYGVTNHLSYTASHGHYTSYIHNEECGDVWVECDDETLRGLKSSEVVTKDAYLLYYKRHVLSPSNVISLT